MPPLTALQATQFQAERLEDNYDFTNAIPVPCRIEGSGQVVRWEECVVRRWKTGDKGTSELLGTFEQKRGKWTLSSGEYLIIAGPEGRVEG
jgi:hypothetical protein